MAKTPQDVIKLVQESGTKIVDLRFTDLPGVWQHFSIPAEDLDESVFEDGLGFDGSSIRGFQDIQESDMNLFPDPETAFLDEMVEEPTVAIICNVHEPGTNIEYTRDPRFVARKAENYLKSTGIADTSFWGPEAEFFIFDEVRFEQKANTGFYYVDSSEGIWNSARAEEPNLGYKIRHKEGYFPCPPMDSTHDLRTAMLLALNSAGVKCEVHHHEVGTAGQAEIDLRYDTLVSMADKLMKYKYIVKNVANQWGKTVTFMPKPLFEDNGSGMHVHCSLWKGGRNLFFDPSGYAGLSETARYFIGGLLKHAPAVLAFAAPTTNSYRRLVPGYEAPINLVYSQRNRSAAVRIPAYLQSEKAKRIEFRCPDPSCNGYLALPAILMAGLDGIQNKIDPGEPIDKNIYDLPPEEAKAIRGTPADLAEALAALEADHEFLLKGDVFTPDVIETWIAYKRKKEVDAIRLRPHPWEFHLYFDI
jgi:glutamine synthetase